MKRHNSYFLLTHQICLLCFLYLYPFSMLAKPQHVFQSKDPIVNFAWDENDTSRYEGHYRYEQAYKMIEDMLSDVDNISKWLSVDPLADQYPGISPYAYCAWNPVKYVDPDGRDIYEFDSDGNFTGNVIKQDGDHIGRIQISKDNYMEFSFNDQADAKRICLPYSDKYFSFSGNVDDNAITHVSYVTNSQINSILPEEIEMLSLPGALMYAWSQSRGGNLDFVNTSFVQNGANALFLPSDGKNIGYNNFDFGNYLWGQSMQRLNIPLGVSKFGAHIDNIIHHWPLRLDSPADQRAIINGYNYQMKR